MDTMDRGIVCHPLTSDRWSDFERLFGRHGAMGGCWCMWWRQTASEFSEHRGEDNRRAHQAMVKEGRCTGLLAYLDDQPIGWCAVGPRADYPRLMRSRILAPIDGADVWAVVCFFVEKTHRRQGVATALLRAAIEHVRAHGGRMVEGYPKDSEKGAEVDSFVYTGLASSFRSVGFTEVERRAPTRPIMRYDVSADGLDEPPQTRTSA